jgi:hypothetical protein
MTESYSLHSIQNLKISKEQPKSTPMIIKLDSKVIILNLKTKQSVTSPTQILFFIFTIYFLK